MIQAPNPIDLTTLAAVKGWLSANGVPPTNTTDDYNIQACITAFSATFLQRTGECPQDGTEPTQSLFISPVSFSEVYDGNGSLRMFLRHRPIQSISSLLIGNQTIPISTGWGVPGVWIDGTKSSISLQQNGGGNSIPFSFWNLGGFGCGFWEGIQNVAITYTAGYGIAGISQSQLVVGGTGYAVNDMFTVNGGTTLVSGLVTAIGPAGVVTSYQLVTSGAGYTNASVVGTTHTLGTGTGLTLLIFVSPPNDVELAARKSAALNYKRRSWIGLRSTSLAQGAGTTSYQEWEFDAETLRVFQNYTNWAVV